MVSDRAYNGRHRFRSLSGSSPIFYRSPNHSRRVATKQPPMNSSATAHGSAPQKWDINAWRRGKRRRCDGYSPDINMDSEEHVGRAPVVSPSVTALPTSSADFNLFPKEDHLLRPENGLQESLEHAELMHLRSNAFWELHQSVLDNGEGFVRRMRDYEQVRSKDVSLYCARRGRKRTRVSQPDGKNIPYSDFSEDEDEIQIFSGDTSNDVSSIMAYNATRPTSLGVPRQCQGDILSNVHHSDGELLASSNLSESLTSSSIFSFPLKIPFPLSPPIEPQPTIYNYSEPTSLLPSPSFLHHQPPCPDKVVEELTLSIANGACSLNDYICLQHLANQHQIEIGDSGDLWQ